MQPIRFLCGVALAAVATAPATLAGAAGLAGASGLEGVPRYDHVVVIIEENKDYDQIVGGVAAPNISRFAKAYGNATRFYGETHPSEGNYVAFLGGDTLGIHDDDAYYCKPGLKDPDCASQASQPDYPDHTAVTPHLGDQLQAAGYTWKGYFESLPAPGSMTYIAGDPKLPGVSPKTAVYASKHSGFVNFTSTQHDPDRARHLVGFDRLEADLAKGDLPNFALVVPNQCNEMHGLSGPGIPGDCQSSNVAGLIRRGDAETGDLVAKLQATRAWRSSKNMAIVITFDEGAGRETSGCCGPDPTAPTNRGGGHIPTIVITNHGPRGLADATPFNHYSLLRTIEDAFGVTQHLGHAAEPDKGGRPMTRLFGGA
jgi:phospholipase C